MRRIDEVVSDIKSILNNIERTEECYGETLVDIDELCDEILAISCKPQKTNADRIRNMTDEELANYIEPIDFDCSDYCAEFGNGCAYNCTHNRGKEYLLEWLQSEVKEEKE